MSGTDDTVFKGEQLLAEFEYDKARKKFNEAIKADPKNARAHFGKAEASLGIPKLSVEEILELYKKAVELEPDNVFYLTTLGSFCTDIGRFNEAEEFYNKATEIDEENASLYFSEFAIGYYTKAPIIMEKFLDDSTRLMIKKKSLEYLLKALDMSEDEAKKLLE
jgi:tetratricopeptide (TPR) repeat protein